jgi:hypothetical protein
MRFHCIHCAALKYSRIDRNQTSVRRLLRFSMIGRSVQSSGVRRPE